MAKLPEARTRTGGFRQVLAWTGAHPLLCAAVFFAFAFVLRLLLGRWLGPILLLHQPDEFRYFHLAKSIAQGGPLLIQGEPAQFQKILYSLIISPAFLLARDPVAQVKLIEVINCLAMASMVFPMALLARKLSKKPAVLLLTQGFACLLPDFIFTNSFMCEPLYWPLCIWVFFFFHCAMAEQAQRRRLLLFALLGFFTWLAYLTKEVGAAFLIAAAAMLIYEGLREKRLKQNALALAVNLFAFFLPLIIVQQALFPGVANSYSINNSHADYDHLGLSVLREPGTLAYMIYSAAVVFVAAVVSFYILPVLLPLFDFRRLGREKQRMALFAMASLAVTAGAMAFTIREPWWWGDLRVRLFLRLLAPLVIPLVILCFDLLLSREKKNKKSRARLSALVFTAALSAITLILLPAVPKSNSWADHASLSVSHLAWGMISDGMDRACANSIWLAWLACMLALAIAGVACFVRGKRKPVLIGLLCAVFALCAMDNVLLYHAMRRDAAHYGSDAHAAAAVDDYLRQAEMIPDGDLVVCLKPPALHSFDTCTSQQLRLFYLDTTDLEDYLAQGNRELVHDDYRESKGMRVQYIVVAQEFNPFANVEIVFARAPFLVLRNLDPARYVFSKEEELHG